MFYAYSTNPQLRKIWAMGSNLSRHILVRTVRLTVETNLVTSKRLRAFDGPCLMLVQPLSVSQHW